MSWWRRRRARPEVPASEPPAASPAPAASQIPAATRTPVVPAGQGIPAGLGVPAAGALPVSRHPVPVPAVDRGVSVRLLEALYAAVPVVAALQDQDEQAQGTGREDPHRTELLYRLEHALQQGRRFAENLALLSGREQVGQRESDPAALDSVLRAAASPILDYARVEFGPVEAWGVQGPAAVDVIRVVAELLDNGAQFSPADAPVRVEAGVIRDGGLLIRVEDDGVGAPPDLLPHLNRMLAEPRHATDLAGGPADGPDRLRLGLRVVALLAARHGLTARLYRRPQGTTATVWVPGGLVFRLPDDRDPPPPPSPSPPPAPAPAVGMPAHRARLAPAPPLSPAGSPSGSPSGSPAGSPLGSRADRVGQPGRHAAAFPAAVLPAATRPGSPPLSALPANGGLPRRAPASIRDGDADSMPPAARPGNADADARWAATAGDIAASIRGEHPTRREEPRRGQGSTHGQGLPHTEGLLRGEGDAW